MKAADLKVWGLYVNGAPIEFVVHEDRAFARAKTVAQETGWAVDIVEFKSAKNWMVKQV